MHEKENLISRKVEGEIPGWQVDSSCTVIQNEGKWSNVCKEKYWNLKIT